MGEGSRSKRIWVSCIVCMIMFSGGHAAGGLAKMDARGMSRIGALNQRPPHGAACRQSDVLLLAGDASEDIRILRETLGQLRGMFGRVFFCAGNHELWVRGGVGDPRYTASCRFE